MASQIQEVIKARRLDFADENKDVKVKPVGKMRQLHMVQYMKLMTELHFMIPLQAAANEAISVKKTDSYSDDILDALDVTKTAFEREYTEVELLQKTTEIGLKTSKFNKDELHRISKQAVGIDLFANDPWLGDEIKAFAEDNVAKIVTINDRYFSEIQDIAFRGTRNGDSYSVIKKNIQERYGVSKWNAERIARDQVLTLNSQLDKIRQKNVGFKSYIWRDVNDNRVRSSHAANDGKVFFWSRPPSTGYPGEDILCRCYAEPNFKEFFGDKTVSTITKPVSKTVPLTDTLNVTNKIKLKTAKMTKKDVSAITEWQAGAYNSKEVGGSASISNYLRNGSLKSFGETYSKSKFDNVVASIDDVFKKSKVAEEIEVLRGVRDIQTVFGKKIKDIKIGDTFIEKSFMSTTYDRNIANKFSQKLNRRDEPAIFKIRVVKDKRIVSVSDIISDNYEKELLLPRNKTYKITNMRKSGQKYAIDLEIV